MQRRRRYERFRFLASALVASRSGKVRFQAYVTSLSRGGLGLFSKGFLEVGEPVELEISWTNAKGQAFKDHLQGTVVSSQVDIEGNILGVEFAEVLGQKNKPLWEFVEQVQQTEAEKKY